MIKTIDEHLLAAHLKGSRHIIDARSPAEFEEDHIPGAVNVPVLDNDQRREIGALFRQNPFEARKRGAAYAANNISRFLDSPLIRDAQKQESMLIYCARGGQRSGSLAGVLYAIGFPVVRLAKGYKTWRAYVLEQLKRPLPEPVFVLHGYSGSRKTVILQQLAERYNVLDLEGCACHRGSILGNMPGIPQPGQRAFDTRLLEAVAHFDPLKPTLIEGESRKIGVCQIPEVLWSQMKAAHLLWLELPRRTRVRYIMEDYAELQERHILVPALKKLDRYLPADISEALWEDLAAWNGPGFVEKILEHHYDPLYGRSKKRGDKAVLEADNVETARDVVTAYIEQRLKATDQPSD